MGRSEIVLIITIFYILLSGLIDTCSGESKPCFGANFLPPSLLRRSTVAPPSRCCCGVGIQLLAHLICECQDSCADRRAVSAILTELKFSILVGWYLQA